MYPSNLLLDCLLLVILFMLFTSAVSYIQFQVIKMAVATIPYRTQWIYHVWESTSAQKKIMMKTVKSIKKKQKTAAQELEERFPEISRIALGSSF